MGLRYGNPEIKTEFSKINKFEKRVRISQPLDSSKAGLEWVNFR
jgi:hypothetical protein